MSYQKSIKNNRNFFDELGLEVTHNSVEIGKTYPIFGAITSINSENGNNLEIEINRNITAHLSVSSPEKIETLKTKSFESGIFISKVIRTEPSIVVECQTVIFGRSQAANC